MWVFNLNLYLFIRSVLFLLWHCWLLYVFLLQWNEKGASLFGGAACRQRYLEPATGPPHLVRVYQVHSWIWASRPTVEGFIKYFISALLCCEWVCDVEIVTFCHFNFLEPWQTFYWQLEALATGCVVHALKLSVSHSGNLGQPAAGSVSALILFNCSTMGWQVSRLNLDVMSVNVYDGHLM